MRLTSKTIRMMLRSIYNNRNSIEGLFSERKALTKLFYAKPNKAQREKLYSVSYYLNRKLGALNETLVANKKSYQLTEDVEFHTIFGTGGVGRIRKGAVVQILGIYTDKIVVGCENEALDVPFEACMTPNHPNYNESTFKEIA